MARAVTCACIVPSNIHAAFLLMRHAQSRSAAHGGYSLGFSPAFRPPCTCFSSSSASSLAANGMAGRGVLSRLIRTPRNRVDNFMGIHLLLLLFGSLAYEHRLHTSKTTHVDYSFARK